MLGAQARKLCYLAVPIVLVVLTLAPSALAREHVYHEGDLELSGYQSRVIEDVIFHLTGDLIVRENAHLVLQNASLIIEQSYDDQYCMKVFDDASVELESVSVLAEGGVRLDAWGSARISVNQTDGSGEFTLWLWGESQATISNSTIATLDIGDSASASLVNSTVEAFIRPTIFASAGVVFQDLVPQTNWSWSTESDIAGDVLFNLSIEDCDIGGWGFVVGGSSKIDVVDSTLAGLIIKLENAEGRIADLALGYLEDWHLDQHGLSSVTPNITLHNTSIIGWLGISVGDNCDLTIVNSDLLLVLQGKGFELMIEDSSVSWLGAHSASGQFQFANSTIRNYAKFYDSFISFSGNVDIQQDTRVGAWVNSIVFRSFVIRVSDDTGTPVPGERVIIRNSEGVLVFGGTSDENGEVSASLFLSQSTWTERFSILISEVEVGEITGFFGNSNIDVRNP